VGQVARALQNVVFAPPASRTYLAEWRYPIVKSWTRK